MNITATNKGFQTISLLLFLGLFTACGGSGGGNDGGGGGGTADTTAPTITLTGDNPQTIEVGTAYTELGATAQDNVDGNISANITTDASAVDTSTIGSYSVTYNVTDAAGNAAATQTRTVNVIAVPDISAPIITLTGDNPQTIIVGIAYTELGATAQDNVDGDISANIAIDSGAVDTNIVGSYSVTYNVSDTAGNVATTQTRTVDVIAAVSDNADLSNLSLSVGSLTPAFDPATLAYASDVGFTTISITVTPTLSDTNASVTVNGALVVSGTASEDINLDEGENTLSLIVLAEDGTTQTYTLIITRQAAADFAQQAYIKASNTGLLDRFGSSVAIDGDTLVVGATSESSNATGIGGDESNNSSATQNSGAVYVFIRSGSTWTQQAYIKASNTGINDEFGVSVALAGDTLVVGAIGEDSNATGIGGDENNNDADFSGAVYVFTRSGSTWTQQAYIKASNTDIGDNFGGSVALAGDTLAVGARIERSNATGIGGDESNNDASVSGAVYVFTRSADTWTQQAYIKASNTDANDSFGSSVTLAGDTLAVGATGEDSTASGVGGNQNINTGVGINSGAVYVFTRSAGTWTQQAYIKASNTGIFDEFGVSVALAGDTLAVGAEREESDATGIAGDENNNDANNSGAVYVFTRSAGTWAQQAYIKASNTDANDFFGRVVTLNGDTLAVGAAGEFSNATGIGGDESNNDTQNSGAVYVFARSAGSWTQQAYIKASNTGVDDFFGVGVALDDGTLAVGASGEASNATGVGGNQGDGSLFRAGAVYVFDIPVTP